MNKVISFKNQLTPCLSLMYICTSFNSFAPKQIIKVYSSH